MDLEGFLIIFLGFPILFYIYFLVFFPLIYAFFGKNIYDYSQKKFEKFKNYLENSNKNDFKNYFLFGIFFIFHLPLSFMDYLVRESEYFSKRVVNYNKILADNGIKRRKNDRFTRIYREKESNRLFIHLISMIYSAPLVILSKFAEREFHFFRNHLKILYEKNDFENKFIIKFLKFLNVDNSKVFTEKEDLEKMQIEYNKDLVNFGVIKLDGNNDNSEKIEIEKNEKENSISEKLEKNSIKNIENKSIFDNYTSVLDTMKK